MSATLFINALLAIISLSLSIGILNSIFYPPNIYNFLELRQKTE